MLTKKSAVFRSLVPLSPSTAEKLNSDDSRNAVRSLIHLTVCSLENKPILEGALSKVQIKNATCSEIHEIYGLVQSVIKTFLCHQPHTAKADILKQELKELRFPKDCANDLVSVLTGPRAVGLSNLVSKRSLLPKLISIDWKVNITIASCYLFRVLEPSVVFEISMSNDHKKQFEMSVTKFHHLRYTVATILKEMALIQKKRIFKLSVS